jgi:hypothetical protein
MADPDAIPEPFKCMDCGILVHRFIQYSANDNHLCFECEWLRTIEDPEERRKVQEFLRSKPL